MISQFQYFLRNSHFPLQIELCRLLERARLPHHVVHSVAYLELCASVCRNTLTAALLYDIFTKEHGGAEAYGWESLTSALKAYDRLYKDQKMISSSNSKNQSQNMSILLSTTNQSTQNTLSVRRGDKISIPAQELSGLVAWLQLAAKVAQLNDRAAQRFSDDPSWTMCSTVASLSTSPVPLSLKASLIGLLTAVARLKSTAPR